MASRRPVGAVDTMWLNMDRPNNLMVIDGVMWLDGQADWERVTAVVQERLVDRYPVFRQRPVPRLAGLAGQLWEDDPEFSLPRHLTRVTLPAPGDEAQLQRYVEEQAQRPIPREHPLWECHFIDGFRDGSAIVTRFHHSIADGIALAEVLLSLTDATREGDIADRPTAGRPGRRRSGPALVVYDTTRLVSAVPRLARPGTVMDAVALARQTAHVADKLLLSSNPRTPFTGTPGPAKRTVWSSAAPLDAIKGVARLADATVNDVLVGAVSGALSVYLETHGGPVTDLTTMVPVNLRPVGQPLPRELGNRFALVLLPMPTGVRRPLARLAEAKRRMDAIKHSPEAHITFGLNNAIGRTPSLVERLLVDFFASKAIGVTTNVIGPAAERYIGGRRIAGVLGWVPGSGHQTVGVSIFTYDRQVRVGFKVDAALVPDADQLVAAYEIEIEGLLRMARAA